MNPLPNFDRIARAYRWLEYLALGTTLERTRATHLGALAACRRALVLGDGDGRFTAELLQSHGGIHVLAVDLSPAMLHLLEARTPHRDRLKTICADARDFLPTRPADLIVTHFFLDCLTQAEVAALVRRLATTLPPAGLWLVSEFRIPAGLLGWPARLYVRVLYLAFRVLTGLRVTSLPDHAGPLMRAGFTCLAHEHRLRGLLTAELWGRTGGASAAGGEEKAPPPIATT